MVVVSDSFSIVWLSKGSDSSPITAKNQREAVFFPHFSNPHTLFRVLRQMVQQWVSYHIMPLPGFEPSVELHQPGTFWRPLYQLSYRVLAKRGRILSRSQCKRSWLFETFRLKICLLRAKEFFHHKTGGVLTSLSKCISMPILRKWIIFHTWTWFSAENLQT